MTDNEIIKALDCCSQEDKCQECPYGAACLDDRYVNRVSKDALDLINRQKAEIEKLNIELQAMRGAANSYKAEVERLKNIIVVAHKKLDNLLKEIEGEENEI